jgi:hypothetical protein
MSALPTRETTLLRGQVAQQGQQSRRLGKLRGRNREERKTRPIAERLGGYAQALSNRHRRLVNLYAIYRDQPSIYPLQVEATLGYLLEVRHVVDAAYAYLSGLGPAETRQLRPIGCITKLASLDYLLTELLLNVAMFAQVCQAVTPMRVHLHLTIRTAFPGMLACSDDLLSQLTALSDKAHQEPSERREEAWQ